MNIFNEFKLSNLSKINLYYILILIKVSFAGKFIDLKKLYIYDIYFVVLDTGLYLYDFNNNDQGLIYNFTSNEYKASNNKINITELNYRHRAYIFCLVNEYLFLFNEYTYEVNKYRINEINNFQNYYYNIMPYKIENFNISFFIALNRDQNNLEFYFYNFNLTENINNIYEQKTYEFNNMNIENNMIRCQINSYSTFITCFYFSIINKQNNLASTTFYIKNMDLFIEKNFTKRVNYNITEIKVSTSYDSNFFMCYLDDTTAVCLTNNNRYEFNKINCTHDPNWGKTYKVLYFRQTDDFMLISKKYLTTTILDNHDKLVKLCKQNLTTLSEAYSIIYDNNIKNYTIVKYANFSNYLESMTINILANRKRSKYFLDINDLIDNSNNKEELITNLNEFIKYNINLDYIDENDDVKVQKDGITISLTSTFNLNNEENINSNSVIINFGKCENILRNVYNISKKSTLYLLKLEIEQEYRNYPLIEYEFFYPLDNEKLDILDLNHCKDTNIEILIPIKINDTIDKYNPKSDYYNNICSKATSKNKTDIVLNDRRNEFIKNNMSLCEDNCELSEYDYSKKKAKCSCKVKTSISLDENELDIKNVFKNFVDINKITNIGIVKCYKIVFNLKNLKNNLGFYIISFIIILFFICIFVFYCKSLKHLINEVIKIIQAINIKNQLHSNQQIYSFKNKNNNIRKRNIEIIKSKVKQYSTFKKLKNESRKIINSKKNLLQKNNSKGKMINRNEKSLTTKKQSNNKNILDYTDSELNSLSYKEALKNDKRTYFQYYNSLLKKKQNILFSFYPIRDYNSQIIKSFLFFFFYASDLAINTLFFIDETMHKIYKDSGDFNFLYQLPQIVYSYLISSLINLIIEYLSMSENSIFLIKTKKNINMNARKKIISKMKIKFGFFFIVTFILLLIFLFYVSCFCCIYNNTQLHLIKDSLLSLALSTILPFFINLIPGIFRIPALRSKKRDKSCLYKLSQFIESI